MMQLRSESTRERLRKTHILKRNSSIVLTSDILKVYAQAEEEAATFKSRYEEAYLNVFGTQRPWHSDYSLVQAYPATTTPFFWTSIIDGISWLKQHITYQQDLCDFLYLGTDAMTEDQFNKQAREIRLKENQSGRRRVEDNSCI